MNIPAMICLSCCLVTPSVTRPLTAEEEYLIKFVLKFGSLWQVDKEQFIFYKYSTFRIIKIPNARRDSNGIYNRVPGCRFYFFDVRDTKTEPAQIDPPITGDAVTHISYGGSEFEQFFEYTIGKPEAGVD